jgi:transcriptional regulator with XRE-family HTH domain
MPDPGVFTIDAHKFTFALAEKKWTAIRLSARSGITESMISRIRNGHHQPTGRMLMRIAAALDIDWRELIVEDALEEGELSTREHRLVMRFRKLDDRGKKDMEVVITALADSHA